MIATYPSLRHNIGGLPPAVPRIAAITLSAQVAPSSAFFPGVLKAGSYR